MAYIFYASSQSNPGPGFLSGDIVLRKLIGHAGAFGALALLLHWGLGALRHNPKVYLLAFVIAVAYAAGDEVHQTFTPGRDPRVLDVGIDAAGALFALVSWRLLAATALARSLAGPRRASAQAHDEASGYAAKPGATGGGGPSPR